MNTIRIFCSISITVRHLLFNDKKPFDEEIEKVYSTDVEKEIYWRKNIWQEKYLRMHVVKEQSR